jgi:ER membrane protein complex subunit 2
MSVDLVNPPPNLPPATALSISQRAPAILKSTRSLPWPLSLLSGSTDTPENWSTFENLFLSCLRTGDDESAHGLLNHLRTRFGATNERVTAFQAMYDEARVKDEQGLIAVLKAMGDALEADPTNLMLQKRRIALLRSMGRVDEATKQLVDLLQVSPIDAEAWAELADMYLVQAQYDQSIYCLEEVLLIVPNAWNVHAKLGEVIYLSGLATLKDNQREMAKAEAEALRRFCRSIELCNNYLRGYYGLKLVSETNIIPRPSRTRFLTCGIGFQAASRHSAKSDIEVRRQL